MLTKLDIVNNCLATMGEAPLTELEEDHPFVASAVRILDQESRRIQQPGWWFNKEYIDLYPDPISKFIYTPGDTISCDPVDKHIKSPVVQRGRRLYDTDKNSYEFTKKVECVLIREIPYDDLPPIVQDAVNYKTVFEFQSMYDADGQKASIIGASYQQAMITLESEHIRRVKVNMLERNDTGRRLYNIGLNNSWRGR